MHLVLVEEVFYVCRNIQCSLPPEKAHGRPNETRGRKAKNKAPALPDFVGGEAESEDDFQGWPTRLIGVDQKKKLGFQTSRGGEGVLP